MADGDVNGRSWYRGYVLLVVGLVSIMNYYDRSLLTILIEPIERDLHLTDGQVGVLAGLGFALMYSILGVPIARLADQYGRARVLACVLTAWSVMTMMTGATVNFTTMLLTRVGVGVGEAGGLPAAQALIADYFPPKRRTLALSTMGIAGIIGMSLALSLGGLISDRWGWRMAFYLGGVPGLVLTLLVLFTIRDRQSMSSQGTETGRLPPLGASFKILWRRKAFVLLCTGVAIAAISAYGSQTWNPDFLMRAYGMSAGEVGTKYSLATGPASILAILAGGLMNDWLLRRDARWPVWILMLSFGLSVPLGLAFYLIHNFTFAMVMTAVSSFIGSLWIGPAYAVVQSLAGPRFRALCAALFMMIVNIIGLGLGPVVPGLLSDALAPHFGNQSLMISLSILTVSAALSIIPFQLAAGTLEADIVDANR